MAKGISICRMVTTEHNYYVYQIAHRPYHSHDARFCFRKKQAQRRAAADRSGHQRSRGI